LIKFMFFPQETAPSNKINQPVNKEIVQKTGISGGEQTAPKQEEPQKQPPNPDFPKL